MAPSQQTRHKPNARAEQLKSEGNDLLKQGRYKDAYKKYTAAIDEDPSNSILWANRASASLGSKEYKDAESDALKATELDPKNHKAHSRLAQTYAGLHLWELSVKSWFLATMNIPKKSLSPQDKQLKAVYKEGYQKAQLTLAQLGRPLDILAHNSAPWVVAMNMEQQVISRNAPSSALVIISAYKHFSQGIYRLSLQKKEMRDPKNPDVLMIQATDNVLVELTEGILRDPRVFHTPPNSIEFCRLVDSQVSLEERQLSAWVSHGPKKIKEEVLKVTRAGNWKHAAKALSVTLRAWVITGCIQRHVLGRPTDLFRNTLQVVEWGLKHNELQNLNSLSGEKYGVLTPPFWLGVTALYLTSLVEIHKKGQENPHGETIDDIPGIANGLLAELSKNPYVHRPGKPLPFALYASIYLYPASEAHAALGWYYFETFDRAKDLRTKVKTLLESASHYLQAANLRPKDDEKHTRYIERALYSLWRMGVPVGVTLPLMDRIRQCLPLCTDIWYYHPSFRTLQSAIPRVTNFHQVRGDLARGAAIYDTIARPAGCPPPVVEDIETLFRLAL